MERRLGALLHGLTSAYCKLFKRFASQTLVPRWKTLVLEDQQGVWLGRLKYQRRVSTANTNAQSSSDWECIIQLPEEHYDKIMEAWKDLWYDQLKKQMEMTNTEAVSIANLAKASTENHVKAHRLSQFMTSAIPEYSAGEEDGIENWVIRSR